MTRLIQLGEARMGADPGQTEKLIDSFLDHFRHRHVLPSIQMMRQAMKLSTSKDTIAHFASSWTVPIVNWNRPFRENSALIKEVYLSGAGSGFILDTADDPVGTAKLINDLLAGTEAPVRMGGGAQLSVRHPRIREFIECKAAGLELPYLGTSVRLTQGFVNKLSIGEGRDIWHRLIESAWRCGDPGILMPYEFPNGTPEIGDPRTAATCADVSLYPNERCVFLNVNVAAFLRPGDRSMDEYDYRRLYDAVRTMARVGDAALELGLSPGDKANHEINYLRRKLSIAPLGVSDLAWRLGLPYGSAAFTNMLSVVLGVFDHASISRGRPCGRAWCLSAVPVRLGDSRTCTPISDGSQSMQRHHASADRAGTSTKQPWTAALVIGPEWPFGHPVGGMGGTRLENSRPRNPHRRQSIPKERIEAPPIGRIEEANGQRCSGRQRTVVRCSPEQARWRPAERRRHPRRFPDAAVIAAAVRAEALGRSAPRAQPEGGALFPCRHEVGW